MGRDFCNETELRAVVSLFQLKKDLDIKQLYTYLCPVIIFVCFFSIIFNAILMSISRQSKAVNKSPILLLSLNLALTDLIASLFNGLGILFNSYLPEVFDRKMPPCAMLTFEVIRCAALIASALHLLALAFVHYRGIVNPLHYRSTIFFSQHLSRSVNIISVCCWIIPLTIMIVWFSSTPCQGFQTAQCDYLFLTQFNFRYMMLTVFSVPLMLMSAIYIRIFLIINRHQKSRRLQHEQSALVCGVVNAAVGVSGAAASVNLPELMMAGAVGVGGGCAGPVVTGGVGSTGSKTSGQWQTDKQEQATADRCPVCSGHRAGQAETATDYYTSENDDDDDEDDDDDDEEEADGDDDGDDSGNNDQEGEDCRQTTQRGAEGDKPGISVLSEELGSASESEQTGAAGARTGERAMLICTREQDDERVQGNKSKTQDDDDGGGGVGVTRMAADGGASSSLVALQRNPLADDGSFEAAVAAATTTRTKGGVSGQLGGVQASERSREASGWRARDSLRDESSASAGAECDMNLNKRKQGQSLDDDASQVRRRAGRRLRRERRKLRLLYSSSLSSSSRGAGGLESSQSSSDQNNNNNNNSNRNNPEKTPLSLEPPTLGNGSGQRCTCDNKLKPAATAVASSERAVKLARANTIGFTTATANGDKPLATMGTSLRILRQPNGQPQLTKTATVVTVAAGDAGSSISACASYSGTPAAAVADSRARSRPSPLRLQLRRSPTSPATAAAAAPSDAGSAHSSVRASSYTQKRLRSTKIDTADATSVSVTTMTSGIPPTYRSFGWAGAKNNLGAWASERTSANSSMRHHQHHHEPQRRHVHASAVPQTNTKALVTTLLILGTYVVSYVPAIAWHALTCIDSVVCPFPLYGIPYGWRVLFGSMTTLLLIAKSIVDPLIYSYRMNEIQVALSRYLSKRRSKTSSRATSLHTSQRFTFNAGGGGGGGGAGDNTTYQTNAGGQPSTANSSFKILTNSHNSSRYKKANNFAIGCARPSPLAATPTAIAKPSEMSGQADNFVRGETSAALITAKPLIVTNQNVAANGTDNVIALDQQTQMIELVRVDQTNDSSVPAPSSKCATKCNGQREASLANVRVKSLKFDEELTEARTNSAGNNNQNNIPKTMASMMIENSSATNSIVVNVQQQQQQRLTTRHNNLAANSSTTTAADSARGDLVC